MTDVTMPSNPRMQRVRRFTTVLIGLVWVFFLYWSFAILYWLLPFVFGGGMQANGWVEEGVVVSVGQRTVFFGLYVTIIALAWFTFAAALRLLLAFRSGAFFALETCGCIQKLGVSLTVLMIAETAITSVVAAVLTWSNAPLVVADGVAVDGSIGFIAPRYSFDSGDITILLCGLCFYAIGWVLAEGCQIDAENKAFV